MKVAHEAASILAENKTAEIGKNLIEILKKKDYTQSIKREMKRYSIAQQTDIEITKMKEKE